MSRTDGPTRGDHLDAIAARARMDAPPALDVTAAVLRRLRTVSVAPERPMLWLAAAAIAAAAIVAIISMPYLSGTLDPLTEFLADANTTVI
jgi:hypothetical protein